MSLIWKLTIFQLSSFTAQHKEKEKEMSIEELEKRERDAYEAFMEADWMHADMRLNEWLDAAHELNEAKGL